MVAAVTSLPGVCFFIFHYESGLVLKIVFEKYLFGAPFFPFIFFFIFEHFPPKKWKKEHAHINGGGCNKLATCLLFHFPLREWPRSENRSWKVFVWCAFFFCLFLFSFSSISHRRNEKRTRAHQRWRLWQARHVFAFSFSFTRVASFWKSLLKSICLVRLFPRLFHFSISSTSHRRNR